MDRATTMEELRTAARALDRMFMSEHYVVPELYGPANRVSHWDKFGIRQGVPKFYTIADAQRVAAVGDHHVVDQGPRQAGRGNGEQRTGEADLGRRRGPGTKERGHTTCWRTSASVCC